MTIRTRWTPFQDLRSAQDELAQMQGMPAGALGQGDQQEEVAASSTPAWAPALDISERTDTYLMAVEIPGVQVDDLQITLEDGLLTIQGERYFAHDSSERRFHRIERHYGAFRRSITLPARVVADAVEASTDGGVLQIVLPKAEQAMPRRITVRPGRADVPAASAPRE
jgi:HSP20 family protein